MIGSWLMIFALTFGAFAIAAFTMRLPREGFAVFGAFLLLGVVGYSFQGSPELPGAPKQPDRARDQQSGEAMVDARQAVFGTTVMPQYLVLSDGLARNGKFADAAALLRGGLRQSPDDVEAWVALGMALTAHADGVVTPASFYAYGRARGLDPANPAADLFLGNSFLQTGNVLAARDTWAGLLANSPDDAPWRAGLEERLERLDEIIARAPMLQ